MVEALAAAGGPSVLVRAPGAVTGTPGVEARFHSDTSAFTALPRFASVITLAK